MDGMEALKSAGVTNFKVFSLSHMEQFLLAGPVVVSCHRGISGMDIES